VHESILQKAVAGAVKKTGLARACHLPHLPSFVRHAPFGERLRYPDGPGTPRPPGRETTLIYTHVLNRGGKGVKSPLDKA
jgi:hypothetical protein